VIKKLPKANDNVLKLNRLDDRGSDRNNIFRFDKNERTYPFRSELIKQILSDKINSNITMYPDQNNLYKMLSKKLKIETENILLCAGSDAGLKHIFETYLSKEDTIIYLSPTYAMVEVYANLYEIKKIKIEYNNENKISLKEIIEYLIKFKPKCFFIANPNQPTGTFISRNSIEKISNLCKKYSIIFVLDHAYFDFVPKNEQYKIENLITQNPFLIVLNTFSKSYGLAGIRLGFLLSNKHNINKLYKVKSYADINYFSIVFGLYFLKNKKIFNHHLFEVKKSKSFLKKEFSKFINYFEFIDSYTNFIHLRFKSSKHLNEIYNFLKKKNIIVRINYQGLPATIENSLRITIPSFNQAKLLISNVKNFYKKYE